MEEILLLQSSNLKFQTVSFVLDIPTAKESNTFSTFVKELLETISPFNLMVPLLHSRYIFLKSTVSELYYVPIIFAVQYWLKHFVKDLFRVTTGLSGSRDFLALKLTSFSSEKVCQKPILQDDIEKTISHNELPRIICCISVDQKRVE